MDNLKKSGRATLVDPIQTSTPHAESLIDGKSKALLAKMEKVAVALPQLYHLKKNHPTVSHIRTRINTA